MKLNHIIFLSTVLLGASGYSQTGAGTGTGTTGTPTPVAPTPGTRVTPPPLLPRGQNPPQLPANPANPQLPGNPNLPQQGELPGQNSQFSGTNAGLTPVGSDTNQFILWNTNQAGSNQVGLATNQFGSNLPAASQPGFTNRIMATNTPGLLTNNNPLLTRDQAVSETDRRLLGQIRTAVFGSVQTPAGGTVHFILRDGAVRLAGSVPTLEEQQRIQNIVQQVPGVVRVYDALQVVAPAAPVANPTVPSQNQ